MEADDPRPTLRWFHLGRIGYNAAWERQRQHWTEVVDQGADEVVLTLEHTPVLTLGRRGKREDLLIPQTELDRRGIEVVESDRGGEVTWHGPGQLVIYLIANVKQRNIGPSDLVRKLAEAVRRTAADYGVEAAWDDAHPGLWVDGRKLAAVGMRISRGASLHGASLNVDPDLSVFSLFVPCGMPGAIATSLAAQRSAAPNWEDVADHAATHVADVLGSTRVRCDDVPAT